MISAAAADFVLDPAVIKRDRNQSVFSQSFLQFSDRMISASRFKNGQAQLEKHRLLFAKVERDFGVPAEVLTSFWGLESDFGAITGNFRLIRSLATLAYDCRRSEFFREELVNALRIVQRGDQTIEGMNGNWAGEFGALQITAGDAFRNAVDYDGDGRRDLIHSVPDTVASAANFLKNLGWQRGQPWLQEVRLTADMPWEQADIETQHPVSQWKAWGVRAAAASCRPTRCRPRCCCRWAASARPSSPTRTSRRSWAGIRPSSIRPPPPISRRGLPARRWSAAAMAKSWCSTAQQIMDLQRALLARGYDVGEVDGKMGAMTRKAVKQAQLKVGLPADSYPTVELIEKLRVQTTGNR